MINPVDVADNIKKLGRATSRASGPARRPPSTSTACCRASRWSARSTSRRSACCRRSCSAQLRRAVLLRRHGAPDRGRRRRSTRSRRSRRTWSRASTRASRRARASAGGSAMTRAPPAAARPARAPARARRPQRLVERLGVPADLDRRHAARRGRRGHARSAAQAQAVHGRAASSCPTTIVIGVAEQRLAPAGRAARLHPRRLSAHRGAGRGARRACCAKLGAPLERCVGAPRATRTSCVQRLLRRCRARGPLRRQRDERSATRMRGVPTRKTAAADARTTGAAGVLPRGGRPRQARRGGAPHRRRRSMAPRALERSVGAEGR